MSANQRYLTAEEAARLLGVSTATLYAYVSRGLLRSEPGGGKSRARRYLPAEVEALQARKEHRREPAKAAAQAAAQAAGAALAFGMPVLDSALTLIEHGKLYYRGRDVEELAQAYSFEEVAALLWTGDFAQAGLFPAARPQIAAHGGAAAIELANSMERCQAVLAQAAAADLAAHQLTPSAVAATGARILSLAAAAITGRPCLGTLAASLQAAWAPEQAAAADLLSAALILCADHELNVSAFTARCVASAGSSPYAVVIAALSALQGFRHGGQTVQVSALLDAASHGVRPAIAAYLRSGDQLPGFGHILYPDGDPRASLLLALLGARLPHAPAVRLAAKLCAEVEASLGLRPTIDLALGVMAGAIGAPRHAPLAVFALGRMAGWIAHALEQYALDQLIRPRARYVGPLPAP